MGVVKTKSENEDHVVRVVVEAKKKCEVHQIGPRSWGRKITKGANEISGGGTRSVPSGKEGMRRRNFGGRGVVGVRTAKMDYKVAHD